MYRSFLTFSCLFALCFAVACQKTASSPAKQTKRRVVEKRATSRPVVRRVAPRKVVRKAPPKRRKPLDFRTFLNKPPKGFVSLKAFIPGIRLSVRYHTPKNFTEAPLPGYGAPGAWMLERPAKALAKVQKALAKKGLGLLVYDAYRPVRGTLGMGAWARRTKKLYLFRKGYIARRSGHNHGHTVDLTIVDAKTGTPLDMGTPWDTLNTRSHTRNAKGKALKNRLLLRRVMIRAGFRPYYKEWWHFRFRMKGTRPRDVPYGCYEAPEGKWKPTKGWDKPGYTMPMKWSPKPCK
jgi:D-alanyl-D-alanine dipeptidase